MVTQGMKINVNSNSRVTAIINNEAVEQAKELKHLRSWIY